MIELPRICLIDVDDKTTKYFKENFRDVYCGTLGPRVELELKRGDSVLCSLNCDIPNNIHEYSVFIINTNNQKTIKYEYKEQEKEVETDSVVHYLEGRFPTKYFNPRDYSLNILGGEIKALKSSVIVIYIIGKETETTYYPIRVLQNGNKSDEPFQISTYSNLPGILRHNKISGNYVDISKSPKYFKDLFEDKLDGFKYKLTFSDKTIIKDGAEIRDPSFCPVLYSDNDDIISYAIVQEKRAYVTIPSHNSESEILIPIVMEFLSDIYPEVFPVTSKNSWITSEDYSLPNFQKLVKQKKSLKDKLEVELSKIDKKISTNHSKYSFLHDMLIKQSDELVDNLIKYFKWLEFPHVVKVDDSEKELKEEDISIEHENGLLVIEVKGIRGTSKDSDCSQINKIKYRRSKERGKFDVTGLYIVNHQRHLEPKARRNPPFSKEQINDANNEERGLLTTWQLFQAYYNVSDGLLRKAEIRKQLNNYGHITFTPQAPLICKVESLHFNDFVFISVVKERLTVGDTLICKREGQLLKLQIESLRILDEDVDTCENKEVGVKVNVKLKINDDIYIKNWE